MDLAVITHGHSDHARSGSRCYLTEDGGRHILQARLGPETRIETLPYGQTITRNGVKISLHPAGHILGSSQVRLEKDGEVCVVSGDYKLENDGTCVPFEPLRCHTFVTESTFGLPIYHWRPQAEVLQEINQWWRDNQAVGRTSVLYCYALGKAQRILAGVDASIGPILLHGAAERFLPAYTAAGATFPPILKADAESVKQADGRGLVLAPGSADNTPWLRKFGEISTAFASGWMQIRGWRRRQSVDRGFVLSDHADWDGLRQTIKATGAENIWVTHGYTHSLVRYLRDQGRQAEVLETRFQGELQDEGEGIPDSAPPPREPEFNQ